MVVNYSRGGAHVNYTSLTLTGHVPDTAWPYRREGYPPPGPAELLEPAVPVLPSGRHCGVPGRREARSHGESAHGGRDHHGAVHAGGERVAHLDRPLPGRPRRHGKRRAEHPEDPTTAGADPPGLALLHSDIQTPTAAPRPAWSCIVALRHSNTNRHSQTSLAIHCCTQTFKHQPPLPDPPGHTLSHSDIQTPTATPMAIHCRTQTLM